MRSSIMQYRQENGRTYHSYKESSKCLSVATVKKHSSLKCTDAV